MMTAIIIFGSIVGAYFFLVWKASRVYPILYLFLFTYILQYLFSTYLIYNEYNVLFLQMPMGQERYFEYAIPAVFSLFLGVFLFNKDVDVRDSLNRIDPVQARQMGYLLLFISYSIDLSIFFNIGALASITSFTTYLKYSAAFCFLFTRSTFNYFLIGLIYLQLGFIALRSGVFINFFIWSTYLFFFIALKFQFSLALRFSFILIAAPILITVQSVKNDYREATWSGKRERGLEFFTELVQDSGGGDNTPYLRSEGVVATVGRLTQGWHLSMTLKHVPKKRAFADGQEIWDDIVSSLVPRLLVADKKSTGSQEKFYRYTGHKLHGSTSMTIGILGDFYINFGWGWSFVMLFVFGAIIAKLLYYFILRFVLSDPLNIVWIPYLLTYLVRANNEFYTVFNNMTKGILIFLFINFLRKKLWPTRTLQR